MSFKNNKISIIGLGYVGIPLAIEFSKKYNVVGYDTDAKRINELKKGHDKNNEINKSEIKYLAKIKLTSLKKDLSDSDIYIVTVPTPIDENKAPNLKPLIAATNIIGTVLSKNNIVIYESTVYPGCTEEVCVPILERVSSLRYNKEFYCGYSPERINPGDKNHTLTKIKKITSGSNEKVAYFIDRLYKSIIVSGTYMASSIIVAEAAKIIENTQRDVNIALINELAVLFKWMKIDTKEVIDAAKTKWNFIPYEPGLVGGHCIGVDPYYLTYKAQKLGFNPQMILAGREVNDKMGLFLADTLTKMLKEIRGKVSGSKVAILGLSFKENCSDLRNTKVISILDHLKRKKIITSICDPWANKKDAKKKFDIDLISISNIYEQDAVILAVPHEEFLNININQWKVLLSAKGILMDIKSIYPSEIFINDKITHWRL